MDAILTSLIGIILTLCAGAATGFGQILEKKVINSLPAGTSLSKTLYKKPMWVVGFSLEYVVTTIFYMTAQLFIGPSLIPGLMAISLVILAIGSVKILGEKLKTSEIVGIMVLILGIIALVFSNLEIDIMNFDLLEPGFILRSLLCSVILFSILIVCSILQKQKASIRGIALAIGSGVMYALSNMWISPLMGTINQVLGGNFSWAQFFLFVWSCIMLVSTNILAVGCIQKSYQYGHASNLISIQQVPVQIVPIFLFFFVFAFAPRTVWSIPTAILGVSLILLSSFLLGKRQESLEKINTESKTPESPK